MTLTLQIENYDVLEDGGPAQFTVKGRGFQAGRSPSMDWVLPDPSRHISSHHFEVTFADGAYWLTDVSTNGTFLAGQRYRMERAHRLSHMDRFQVGHYIIIAVLGNAPAAPPPQAPGAGHGTWSPRPMAGPGPSADDDPWSVGGGAAEPIDPLPRPEPNRFEDFADDFIVNPMPAPDPGGQHPAAPPVPPVASAPQPALQPPVAQHPAPASPPMPADGRFLAAFCKGAELPPGAYPDVDDEALALMLGQAMRIVARDLMVLLQDRASAKQFTKGGERTMRRASDNNPLKFLPDADQAIEAMFLRHRAGFLTGSDGVAEALQDLRLHQAAVFAAIQPALAKLLSDMAPEVIEEEATGGLMLGGGKRSKAWETYVQRWDAKTHPHENGILDEFLKHFSEAYADMTKSGRT